MPKLCNHPQTQEQEQFLNHSSGTESRAVGAEEASLWFKLKG